MKFRYSVGHCKPSSKVVQSQITEHWTMGRWTAINKLDSCIIILSERGGGGRGGGAKRVHCEVCALKGAGAGISIFI